MIPHSLFTSSNLRSKPFPALLEVEHTGVAPLIEVGHLFGTFCLICFYIGVGSHTLKVAFCDGE